MLVVVARIIRPCPASGIRLRSSRRHRRPRSTTAARSANEPRRRAPHAATRNSPLSREVVARHRSESCLKSRARRAPPAAASAAGLAAGSRASSKGSVDDRYPVKSCGLSYGAHGEPGVGGSGRHCGRDGQVRFHRLPELGPRDACRRRSSGAPAAAATPFRAARHAIRVPSRSSTPLMPRGLPRATTRPCSRRQRCTSSTGAPPRAPRAIGSFQRPLPTSQQVKCGRIRTAARQLDHAVHAATRAWDKSDCIAGRSHQAIEGGVVAAGQPKRVRVSRASAPPARFRQRRRRTVRAGFPSGRPSPVVPCRRERQFPLRIRLRARACAHQACIHPPTTGRPRSPARGVLRASLNPSVPTQQGTDFQAQ